MLLKISAPTSHCFFIVLGYFFEELPIQARPSICLSFCQTIYLISVSLFVFLSVRLSVCMSNFQFFSHLEEGWRVIMTLDMPNDESRLDKFRTARTLGIVSKSLNLKKEGHFFVYFFRKVVC